MNRPLLIILAVLILGSAGFGLAQLDEIKKLKQNLAELDQERSALQKRIWDLQKQNVDLENRLKQAPGASRIAASGGQANGEWTPAEGAGPAGPRQGGRFNGGRFGAMMASPEVQKLMAIQQKAGLDSRYASLFKQMQLDPANLEKFKNLLVEKQAAVMDVLSAARAEGLSGPANRGEIQQLVQNAQAEVDTNIHATLGDAGFAQYQNYEATLPEQNLVTQLSQRLSYSTTPLTDAQSAQLVQILAQTAPPTNNSNTGAGNVVRLFAGAAGGGAFGGGVPITSDAITQAQSVLAPQQVAALQSLQQEQQAAAALRAQLRSSMGGPAPAAATSSTTPAAPTPARPSGPGGG